MAYIAQNAGDLQTKANGTRYYGESQECVASVKHFTGAPQTTRWTKGAWVRGNSTIQTGTAIATFLSDGTYKAGHAAIYISQDDKAIYVYDQWRGNKFSSRPIRFGGKGDSNNGDKFYVVD